MKPIEVISGRMLPLDRADVDTDQIMPKQFLKRVERSGFGEFVFFDWRDDPAFVFNDARYEGTNVLVTGPNFGCGSSREHAAWGLQQYGFEAIVAPSFADIFRTNSTKIGLLCVQVEPDVSRSLLALAQQDPAASVNIDLSDQRITAGEVDAKFDIHAHDKYMLSAGLDHIALTLDKADTIDVYERRRSRWHPTTTGLSHEESSSGVPHASP